MSFENVNSFDYSTNKEIDGTLQDKIDELKSSTQKSLQELSKEVFSGLTTLTVDTLNTRLNVRNKDGVIIGKLQDKEKISYLNNHIEKNGKIFVEIMQSNGKPGYVSADYVKADGFDYANNNDKAHADKAPADKAPADKAPADKVSAIESPELTAEKNTLAISVIEIKDGQKRIEIIKKINNCSSIDASRKISEEIQRIIKGEKNPEETTMEGLLSGLDFRLDQFRNIAQETEDLENILGVVWGEEEKIEQQKILLANKYQDILIIISELQKHNIPEVNQKLEGTYLFLAEYYSSNEESLDNDHMRDYNISTIAALGVLKNKENCPNFPNLSELQNKFPNEEDFQRELELGLSAFDERFEDFANKIKDSTDQRAKKAIEIIEDNRGIGYFDFAEDITDSLFHGAGGVGAIIIGTAAVILTAPGWVVGGAIVGGAGLVGASLNTIARGESEGVGQFLGEAGVLSVQVGAAGLIGRASIRLLSTTTTRLATAGVIGAEMAGDVAIVGMLGDYLNSHVFDYDYKLGESFQENLIWAPLVLLGGGGKLLRGNLERAKIKQAVGDQQGVIDEVTQFNTRVGELKTELVGKEVNLDHNGSQITAKIEEDGNIKISDVNGERTLDPENIDDQEIMKLLVKKIDSNNKTVAKDSSTKQAETEIKTNKETGENTGNTIYVSENGTEYKYIKEGAEGKIVVETKKGDIISVNKKNVKLKEGEKGVKEKASEEQPQKEKTSENQNKDNTSDKNESGKDSDKPKEGTINKDDISFNTESGIIKIKGEKVHMVENKSFYMEGTDQQMYRVVTGEKGKIVDVLNVTKSNETSLSGVERNNFIINNIDTIKQDFTIVLSKTELKAFNKEFTRLIEKDGVEINGIKYTKRSDGKYEKSGDQNLYTEKDLIAEIVPADKKTFIEKQAKSAKESLKDGEIKKLHEMEVTKLRNGKYTWGKYKISNKEITIKENGKERILSDSEVDHFYRTNGAELLLKTHGKKINDFHIKAMSKLKSPAFLEKLKTEGLIKNETIGAMIRHQVDPTSVIRECFNAKGAHQIIKAILFGNRNLEWKYGIPQFAFVTVGYSLIEVATSDDESQGYTGDIIENFLVLTYMPILGAIIYEKTLD